jgi:hypothetical protein
MGSLSVAPLGGVVRPRRKVRFARLMHRPGRVLGGPAVRAAGGGGDLSLPWLPLTVLRMNALVPLNVDQEVSHRRRHQRAQLRVQERGRR